MIRTFLIATALLAATGTAQAHDDRIYGRVIAVEPSFSISFGTGHHDGFRVLYESGGYRYWTHTPYHPGHAIVLPAPPHHHVKHVHHYRDHGRDWNDHRGWREERREHWREHRRHGRD